MRPEPLDDAGWTHWFAVVCAARARVPTPVGLPGASRTGGGDTTVEEGGAFGSRRRPRRVTEIVKKATRAFAAFVETVVDWLW